MATVVTTMLLAALGMAQDRSANSAPEVGEAAPEFASPAATWINAEKPIKLSESNDRPTLVIFSTVY